MSDVKVNKITNDSKIKALLKMNQPRIYEIRVEGHLAESWSDWFEGLTIFNEPNGETILSGMLVDQAVLFGVLNKINALNLTLLSLSRSSDPI